MMRVLSLLLCVVLLLGWAYMNCGANDAAIISEFVEDKPKRAEPSVFSHKVSVIAVQQEPESSDDEVFESIAPENTALGDSAFDDAELGDNVIKGKDTSDNEEPAEPLSGYTPSLAELLVLDDPKRLNQWYDEQTKEYLSIDPRSIELRKESNLPRHVLQNIFFDNQQEEPLWAAEMEAVLWTYFFDVAYGYLLSIYQVEKLTDKNFPILKIQCKATICRIESMKPRLYARWGPRCNMLERMHLLKGMIDDIDSFYQQFYDDKIKIFDVEPKLTLAEYIKQQSVQDQITGNVHDLIFKTVRSFRSLKHRFCESFVYFDRSRAVKE